MRGRMMHMKCIKTSAQNHKEMRAALENQYVTWEDREQRRKALKKEKNKWLVLVAAGVLTSVLSLMAGFVTGKLVHFLLTVAYVYATMNCFKQYSKEKIGAGSSGTENGRRQCMIPA